VREAALARFDGVLNLDALDESDNWLTGAIECRYFP